MDSNAHEVIQYHFASSDYRFHGIRLSCAWDDSPAIAAYTPDEKAALFHDTACRAYKLDEIHRYSC